MPTRVAPAASRFIENLGLTTEAEGLPRTAGRLMAYLVLAGEPVTFDEIVRDLGVSRGGVSANTRFLESRGVLERVTRPGERKARYRLTADPFDHLVTGRLARRRRTREVVTEALDALPEGPSPARERLEEMKRFYDILIDRLESVVADWRGGRGAPVRPEP